MSDSLATVESELRKDTQELSSLQSDIRKKEEGLRKAETEEKNLESEIKKKEAELKSASGKRSDLEKEVSSMNSRIGVLKTNCQKLEAKFEELKQEASRATKH